MGVLHKVASSGSLETLSNNNALHSEWKLNGCAGPRGFNLKLAVPNGQEKG